MQVYLTQLSGLEPFSLDASGEAVYRKELLYAGDFLMHDGKGKRFKMSVDEAFLDHIVEQNRRMKEAGVEVPLPLGHSDNPEKRRGTVVGLVKGVNKKGVPSVFSLVKFRDEQTASALKTSQVSAFIPPVHVDGKGNKYYRPVTHVAVTDYPVIPGLEGFESISASLLTSEEEDMSLRNLAEKLGLTGDDARDDVAIETAVLASFKKNQDDLKALKAEVATLKAATPPPADKKPPLPIAAGLLTMAKDNREAKIDRLAEQLKITPAVAKSLKERWCSPEALTLSLSAVVDGGAAADDGFDNVVASLSLNEPVLALKEKSGSQTPYGNHGNSATDQEAVNKGWEKQFKS